MRRGRSKEQDDKVRNRVTKRSTGQQVSIVMAFAIIMKREMGELVACKFPLSVTALSRIDAREEDKHSSTQASFQLVFKAYSYFSARVG